MSEKIKEEKNDEKYLLNDEDLSNFTKLKLLGEGASSKVYLINYQGKYAVLKIVKDPEKIRLEEVYILENISKSPVCHPSIICIHDHFYDDEYRLNIIEEYIDGVTLADFVSLNKPTYNDIVEIMHQLLKGVYYLHSNDVVHRDLKLDNVMLTLDRTLKIIDFDLSCHMKCPHTIAGTPKYIAPEIWFQIVDEDDQLEIFKKSDVYSLGILFYFLIHRRFPYPPSVKSMIDLKRYVRHMPSIKSVSKYPELDRIVNNMLIKDYRNRNSIEETLYEFDLDIEKKSEEENRGDVKDEEMKIDDETIIAKTIEMKIN